jgi:gamma-glutamyltranspeptidase/glutathione hydrolase
MFRSCGAAGLALLLGAAAPPAVRGDRGMAVSADRAAAEVGAGILRAGGNAVDAAVAMGYALAAVDPCCGNIGGGGFMTLRMADGRAAVVDFRETAPSAASAAMFLGVDGKPVAGASLRGWRAAGIPGTVAGLDAALAAFGRMDRARVMAPAIRLAREGFALSEGEADILARSAGKLAGDAQARATYLRADGTPHRPGETLVQPALAATLQDIADRGDAAFYAGRIPQAIEAASGGALKAADFAAYRAVITAPLACGYRGLSILAPPPPSSGGVTVCEILGVLRADDLHALGFHGAASVHLLAEAMRHAFLDRNTYLGDPAFVPDATGWLLSDAHLSAIRAAIGPRATPSSDIAIGVAPHERPETTAYAVTDAAGDAVSVTYTLNGYFGAGVTAPGAGFLLNDEMDDFTTAPGVPNMFGLVQGVRNAIAPGKRPLSSMAPVVVLRDGAPLYVLGSPGGSRIITIVAQVLMDLTDHGMAPEEAVAAPRLHLQYQPDTLFAEPFALSPDTQALLRGMGYRIVEQAPWGAAELIAVAPPPKAGPRAGDDTTAKAAFAGRVAGASDPRRPAGGAVAE